MTPSHQRELIAQLRQQAHQASTAAPNDLAQRIIAGLPPRPHRAPWLNITIAAAAAAAVMIVSGIWWNTAAPMPQPNYVALPVPSLDVSAMSDFFTEPEHPLNGELAALRRDGARLIGFFTEVGAPLRSVTNLGAEQSHVQ